MIELRCRYGTEKDLVEILILRVEHWALSKGWMVSFMEGL